MKDELIINGKKYVHTPEVKEDRKEFWITYCGDFEEGYKPDFRISLNPPEHYSGYTRQCVREVLKGVE